MKQFISHCFSATVYMFIFIISMIHVSENHSLLVLRLNYNNNGLNKTIKYYWR